MSLFHRSLPILFALSLAATPGIAQGQTAGSLTPSQVLKGSMAQYASLSSFQADCDWSMTMVGQSDSEGTKRTIWYVKPNRFKVVSAHGSRMVQTSVSDGKKLVEFATGIETPAQSYIAPPSIAEVATMQMQHPMFCGSLLYKFFGGPDRFPSLVNEAKMPLSFGPPVTLDGQTCKTVTFWAQEMYGKTEVAIGDTDHLVHRIRYGSEPLLEMMRAQKESAGAGPIPTAMPATETYQNIVVGKEIDPAVFTAHVPSGVKVEEAGEGSGPQPPVALGTPAPEIHVASLNGVKRKLSDFRGQVVLIDFWATWCPPCRKGLPETQRFYTEYGKKGLAVLTVSDEAKPTVAPFLKKNNYTFPAYLDAGSATNKAYKIEAIPTVVIIDRKGNLAAYMVGLSPREEILAALKKAGL